MARVPFFTWQKKNKKMKKVIVRFSGRYIENFDEVRINLILLVDNDGNIVSVFNDETNEGVDLEYLGKFLNTLREIAPDVYESLRNDFLFWIGCLSMIKNGKDISEKIYMVFADMFENIDAYGFVSEAEILLKPLSTSLVGGLVFAGIIRPARVFANIPGKYREKIAESIWDQRVVDCYDSDGNPLKYKVKKMVYISYKFSIPSFPDLYAIRCICPSTGQTHWLLIPEEFANNPKAGIAWTCMIPRALHEFGRYVIKRQGDVFLFELIDHLPDQRIKELMESPLIHHPVMTFWDRYIDEA